MKNKIATLSGIALSVSLSLAASMAGAVDVGVGVGLVDEDGGTVFIPMKFGNFKVEPEFNIKRYEEDVTSSPDPINSNESKYRYLGIGAGIYWRQPIGPSLESHIGGRVGYYRNKSSTTYPNSPTNNYTLKSSGFYLGPAIGAEYFFNKQFSIGLDASLIFRSSSGDTSSSGSGNSSDFKAVETETRAALRFYF